MRNLLLLFLCLCFSTLFAEYSADRLMHQQQEGIYRSHALVGLVRSCNAVWYDVQQFWQADDEAMAELLNELDERLEEIYKEIHTLCASKQETFPSFYKYLTHLTCMITKELKGFTNEFGACKEVAALMHKVEEVRELLLIARKRLDIA